MVTLFEDDDSVFMALKAGARGYILKDADEEEMVQAIRAVGRGEAIFSAAVAERVLEGYCLLLSSGHADLALPSRCDSQ